MLDRAADDGSGSRLSETKDCEVVGLGGAAGENHLVGMCIKKSSKLFSGVFQRLTCLPAKTMAAGGVAGAIAKVRLHRFPDRRKHGRRRVVVQIDGVQHNSR